MSDGRKRLSGAAYTKAALEILEKEQTVLKKTAKIFNFFRKPETGHGSGSSDSKSHVETQKCGQRIELSQNKLHPITESPSAVEFAASGETGTTEQKGEDFQDSKIECKAKHAELEDNKDFCNLIPQGSSNAIEHSEKYEKDFVFDLALWPINENTRE